MTLSMDPHALCVLHLNQIGDLLFSLPLLKALRENFPGAAIHSVVKPPLTELLADSPYVDRVLERRSGYGAIFGLLKTIRANRYDLLISLPRSEESLIIAALSGARLKAGFSHVPWDICNTAPAFAAPVLLADGDGIPIAVGTSCKPWVADWNGDGRKDLLLGNGSGTLVLSINEK